MRLECISQENDHNECLSRSRLSVIHFSLLAKSQTHSLYFRSDQLSSSTPNHSVSLPICPRFKRRSVVDDVIKSSNASLPDDDNFVRRRNDGPAHVVM